MSRWLREFGLVAVVGAVCGALVPRVLLPPMAYARAPRAITAPRPAVAVMNPVDEPAAVRAPPSPTPTETVLARPERPSVSSSGRREGAAPEGMRRLGGRWVLDLRGVAEPRALLAGMDLTAPGEPGGAPDGYVVRHTDRAGYAQAAGIRPGDVLVAADGRPLRSPDDALDAYIAGRGRSRATLEFRRGSARYAVSVEVLGSLDGEPTAMR